MSETLALIAATVAKVFQAQTSTDTFSSRWSGLVESGLLDASVPEELGGGGLPLQESGPIVRLAAEMSVDLPVVETIAGKWLLARCGQTAVSTAPIAVVEWSNLTLEASGDGFVVSGTLTDVAWMGEASETLAVVEYEGRTFLLRLRSPRGDLRERRNLAGEPRVSISLDRVPFGRECVFDFRDDPQLPLLYMAALRAVQLSGAMQRALETAIEYANTRVQFGRPIGRFQAVQQKLAEAAGNFAASLAIANEALVALADDDSARRLISVASAKSRCGSAATVVAAVSHQVMGAIGFTREHHLQLSTRRLWSWRDEAGNEDYWNERLGTLVRDLGPERTWDLLSRMGEAA